MASLRPRRSTSSSHNGPRAGCSLLGVSRRPQLEIVAPGASPEEAAAIVAAIEQYLRDTAPVSASLAEPKLSPWKHAALVEGVSRQPEFGEL